MKTYNQILELLKNFAVSHTQVNSSDNGFSSDINNFIKNNQKGNFLFFQPLNIGVNNNTVDYIFRIYSLDFKQKDNDNLNDVLSDCAQILIDLRKYLIYNENLQNVWSVQFNRNQLTPVNNYTADFCAGWYFDITISTVLSECDGDIPFIEGSCPPIAIIINGQTVGESVVDFLINVINQDGEQTGQLIDGNWVVTTGEDCLPITLINSAGCQVGQIAECPENGTFELLDTRFLLNGEIATTTPYNVQFNLVLDGLSIDSIVPSCVSATTVNLNIDSIFPINISNSEGCELDTIETNPIGDFIIKDTQLLDNNGIFGDVTTPSSINIIGADILSATTSSNGCQLDITVDGSPICPPGIVYDRISWCNQLVEYAAGDTGYWTAQGAFDYDDPCGQKQELDWNNETPGLVYYTLKHFNTFGNRLRFTTSTGGGATGGNSPVDFQTSDFVGAIPQYVIDNLTGIAYIVDKITINQTWADSIAAVFALNYGGFNDYRPLTKSDAVSVIPFGSNSQFYSNACILTRGTSFVPGTEIIFWLGDTSALNAGRAYIVNDSGNIQTQAKTTAANTISIFACRRHF